MVASPGLVVPVVQLLRLLIRGAQRSRTLIRTFLVV